MAKSASEGPHDERLTRQVLDFAAELGLLAAVGPADPLPRLRETLRRRAEMGWRADFEPPEDDRRWNPQAVLPGARSVVALGLPYGERETPVAPSRLRAAARGAHAGSSGPSGPAPAPAHPRGRVSRYAAGHDYHRLLAWRARAIAAFIAAHGYRSWWQADTGPLTERAFAAAAGLGEIGRNGLLIVPGAGTWVFLALVLTDAPLAPSRRQAFDPCLGCDRCLRACPTGALAEGGAVDTTRCISYATQRRDDIPEAQRRAMGLWLWGCDVCQDVCPHNGPPRVDAVARSGPAALSPRLGPGMRPGLVSLARLGKGAFRRRWGQSAAAWRGRHVVQRNALVALGNWSRTRARDAGAGVRRAVWQALRQGLDAGRPDIRRHAAWAVAQWPDAAKARAALEARMREERDPTVQDALRAALAACERRLQRGAAIR